MLIRANCTSDQTNLPYCNSKKNVCNNSIKKSFQEIQQNQWIDTKNRQIPNTMGTRNKLILSNIMKQNNIKPIMVENNDLSPNQNINTEKDKEYSLDNFNLDFFCNFVIQRHVNPRMTNDEAVKFDNAIVDDMLSRMIGRPVVDSELSSEEINLRGNLHIALIQMQTVARNALKNVIQSYPSQWNNYIATGKTSINFVALLKNELPKVEFYHSKNNLGLSFEEMFEMIDTLKSR